MLDTVTRETQVSNPWLQSEFMASLICSETLSYKREKGGGARKSERGIGKGREEGNEEEEEREDGWMDKWIEYESSHLRLLLSYGKLSQRDNQSLAVI